MQNYEQIGTFKSKSKSEKSKVWQDFTLWTLWNYFWNCSCITEIKAYLNDAETLVPKEINGQVPSQPGVPRTSLTGHMMGHMIGHMTFTRSRPITDQVLFLPIYTRWHKSGSTLVQVMACCIAWRHQAIIWTNVDVKPVAFCGMHMKYSKYEFEKW